MANNLTSNYTESLAKGFMSGFQADRVLCKSVNTQLLTPKLLPDTNGEVSFKRPNDYNSIRTSGGNISSETKSDILIGKATGVVQNYITIATEWSNVEEALQLGDAEEIKKILRPMATRAVTDLEMDLGAFMYKNAGGAVGTPGTSIATWSDVADTQAYMQSLGIPMDRDWIYAMNPYGRNTLADKQSLLSGNADAKTAWERAQVSSAVAGMKTMTSNALASFTTSSVADRAGLVNGVPNATYVAAKDTMTQSITVDGFGNNLVIKAGEVVEVTGVNRLSLSTRQTFTNASGANVLYRGVVTADVTLSGTGTGTIVVTGPAIQEANGQYNTVDTAIPDNAVITLLGSASEVRQPNLAFHPEAFGVGTVKIPKLFDTDTIATSEDGFSLRVSKYSDGDANTQKVRFDLLPAFICFNPNYAVQGWG